MKLRQLLLPAACLTLYINAFAQKHKPVAATLANHDFMYQYSIIDALLAGAFDGNLTIAQLKQQGDFGIGTFNRADGELIMDEGKLYRVRHDGSVQLVPDTDSTSAAFVKFFKADTSVTLTDTTITYEQVQAKLLTVMNPNSMYAIRIKGLFTSLHSRAEYPAAKPYPTLSEHLKKNQTEFHFNHTEGTAVGFWLPAYMARTNVPGFHCHYLAANKKSGGHLFHFTADALTIELDEIKGFTVELNTHPDYKKVNVQTDRSEELKKIE